MTRTFLQLCQAGRRTCFTVWSWWEPDCPSWRGYWPLQHLHQVIFCHFLRNSASSFHWLSSSIFTYCRSSFGCPASVTPPLISTIWCFRPYKPYIFYEDMILPTCKCHHILILWPSYHHKSDKTTQILNFLKVRDSWLSNMIFWSVVLVLWSIYLI